MSGGGARGAYEVGVLKYVREKIPTSRFQVVTGSSVGAINGAYLAATCDRPRAQMRLLQRMWLELRLDEMYKFGWEQMRSLPQVLFGKIAPKTTHGATMGGLVDSAYIESVVRDRIPWRGIADNLSRGNLSAFACSATELRTGTTTVFVQTTAGEVGRLPSAPGQIVVHTAITAAHALASAAIPVLFPAVRVGDQLFSDGSLRQNTPIRPAMHLGADRLLVIGLRHETARVATDVHHERVVYPNAVYMLGKVLNALLLDRIEADLARIHRTNELIEAGLRMFGPEFPARISEGIHGRRGRPYRKIDVVLIRPTRDIGEIAWDVIQSTALKRYGGVVARWLRRITAQTEDLSESDLGSYVLFDPDFVSSLIDLGYHDARLKHDELCALLDPGEVS